MDIGGGGRGGGGVDGGDTAPDARRSSTFSRLSVCVLWFLSGLSQDLDDIEDENDQLKQENKTLLKVVGQLTR